MSLYFRLTRNLYFATLALLTTVCAATGQQYSTPANLAKEVSTLTKLLDEMHYNRDAVRSSDYASVIPDYMSVLDGQRLFMLETDRTKFMKEYGKNLYYNASFLGNINPAYEIFYVYRERVVARITWIQEQLKGDIDLTTKETCQLDRQKAEWPTTATVADDLWTRRLKYEIVQEMLNKKTMEEAKTKVSKHYERVLKSLGEIEGNELAELFLSTITRLYDPHSTYFSATTFEDFGIQMKLQLVGIGAQLNMDDDYCTVREIIPGGPADLGKELKPNDKIVAVAEKDGEPVDVVGMKLHKIIDKIRGKKGTLVRLMIQPADSTDISLRREVAITRDTVQLDAARASGAVFEVPSTNGNVKSVGVISLPAFYAMGNEGNTESGRISASKDVARLITHLKRKGILGLVLDLRRNGGGYLTEAIDLTGLFVGSGPVVQVKNSVGEIHVDNSKDSNIAYGGPLVVLVDRFSASASEIVAGALQDYGRALVIGDSSTHGKGSVQQVVEMKQLSISLAMASKTGATKFTIQKYYLPSGASTQLKGVVPNIILPSIEDYLPIGEADLPHAMAWDQIPSSDFKGKPFDQEILADLSKASLERQSTLEEFVYLKKVVSHFKERQAEKAISVNLAERMQLKVDEDAFQKQLKSEKAEVAKSDYKFTPIYLGTPPKPKPAKKDSNGELEESENNYVKADVHLKEALRVLCDAVAVEKLGVNRK